MFNSKERLDIYLDKNNLKNASIEISNEVDRIFEKK